MKIRYLFIAAVVFGVLAIVALRLNAQHVYDLKTETLKLDAQATDVKPQLEELRSYIFKHMNTSTKVELVSSYERSVEAAKSAQGGSLYSEAQASCDRQGVSSVAQAQCVQNYLASHGGPETPAVDKTPYVYSFAAPSWSPDIAGFCLLISIGLAITSLVLYVIRLFKNRPDQIL